MLYVQNPPIFGNCTRSYSGKCTSGSCRFRASAPLEAPPTFRAPCKYHVTYHPTRLFMRDKYLWDPWVCTDVRELALARTRGVGSADPA